MKLQLFVVMAVLTAAPTWAHHGAAEFDQTKTIQLSGTISKTEWSNPHVLIHLNVTGEDRKVTEWVVECPPPNWMKRQGVSQTSFEVGTEFVVEGFQAKDGTNRLNAASNTVTFATKDGKLTMTGVKASVFTPVLWGK